MKPDARLPIYQTKVSTIPSYPIHIIVKNGRIMLLGVVDNATDRQLAEERARDVTGVFEVENSLTVVREGQEEARK